MRTIFRRDVFTLQFINQVVRFLIFSDIMLLSSFGLLAPVFAVFITDNINGGTLAVIGIAEMMYLLARSLFQIPSAYLVDRIKGEKDDFWALVIGSLGFSAIPLCYLLVDTPLGLYIVQFFWGLASALATPSWLAIFTRHIDKSREGVEWGVYQTLTGLGGAATAGIGGFVAYNYGFTPLFIAMSLLSLTGTLFLSGIYKDMKAGKLFDLKL